MTRNLIVFALLLGFLSVKAQFTQNIKIGPLGFLFGNYNARYEKVISDKGTFQVGANYFNFKIAGLGVTSYGLDAGYRLYFREVMDGGYFSPALGFDASSTAGLDGANVKYSTLGLGATVGYQWLNEGGFVFDLGFGYGYSLFLKNNDNLRSGLDGGGVRFTFAVGYAF
jgi:hypothetical protein